MGKSQSFLKFIFSNFGPLIIFYFANHFWGLKAAIAASLIYSVAEIVQQKIKREPITPFFIFSASTSVLFGAIDLYLPQSVLFNYEPSFTNVITGIFFIVGAFNKKPLLQELAEKRKRFENPNSPDLVQYFRIFTLIWAAYFFIKAGFYAWLANQDMSAEKMMAIRSSIGGGSLYVMIGLSIFGGRRFFHLMKSFGWLTEAHQ